MADVTPKAAAKPKDPAKENEKNVSDTFEAYYTVAKHQLGRDPTIDDIHKMLSERTQAAPSVVGAQGHQVGGQVPAAAAQAVGKALDAAQGNADSGPKLLRVKIYYGMSGQEGMRKADPNQVLFYEHPNQGWYDCKAKSWLEDRPHVLDHLPSRPIMQDDNDLINAISHGIVDDDDHDQLKGAGMLGEVPSRLFDLHRQLKLKQELLQKSAEVETEGKPEASSEGESSESEEVPSPTAKSGPLGDIFEVTGAKSEPQSVEQLAGEDVLSKIIEACTSALMDTNADLIRQIVREELAAAGIGSVEQPDWQMEADDDEPAGEGEAIEEAAEQGDPEAQELTEPKSGSSEPEEESELETEENEPEE